MAHHALTIPYSDDLLLSLKESPKEFEDEARRLHGPLTTVPTLVTDNGTTFLSKLFRAHIESLFSYVRTRYRTPQQLGLLERFHQTLKQEEIYWELYRNPAEARERLATFHRRYNEVRPHWALVPLEGGGSLAPG